VAAIRLYGFRFVLREIVGVVKDVRYMGLGDGGALARLCPASAERVVGIADRRRARLRQSGAACRRS
jgi:hypothetical protein